MWKKWKEWFCKEEENTYSSAEYDKMLDLILKAAQDEFKQVAYDLPNFQKVALRNYLWLSTVILAAECALFAHVVNPEQGFWMFPWDVTLTGFFYWWASLALLCGVVVFVGGLDTMRGRGYSLCPVGRPYSEFMQMAYEEATGKRDQAEFRVNMINDLEVAINDYRTKASSVGLKLRKMSYALLLSLLFTVFALLPNIPLAAN